MNGYFPFSEYVLGKTINLGNLSEWLIYLPLKICKILSGKSFAFPLESPKTFLLL